jgi:hypothetical protein
LRRPVQAARHVRVVAGTDDRQSVLIGRRGGQAEEGQTGAKLLRASLCDSPDRQFQKIVSRQSIAAKTLEAMSCHNMNHSNPATSLKALPRSFQRSPANTSVSEEPPGSPRRPRLNATYTAIQVSPGESSTGLDVGVGNRPVR